MGVVSCDELFYEISNKYIFNYWHFFSHLKNVSSILHLIAGAMFNIYTQKSVAKSSVSLISFNPPRTSWVARSQLLVKEFNVNISV